MAVGRSDQAGSTAAALLLAVLVALFVIELRHPLPQIDDAYITYQYARNFVEGHGLVFNRGEYVEGYSNPLWTLLVACGLALGVRADTAGWLLGVASGVAALIATYVYARSVLRRDHAWMSVAAAAIVLATSAFPIWAVQGMETALFAAAVTATLSAAARGRVGWATCFAIVATLNRMEGALLAAVVLGLDAVASWRRLHSWRWVTAYVAFVVLLTAYRLAYYGLPLPNVFYAKVGGVPVMAGIGYLVGFLYDGAVWLVPAAVVGAATDRRLRSAGAFVAIYTAYVVWIGGDAFDQWRFFVPIVPALAVFAVRGVETASSRSPYASMLLTVTIPIAVVWLVLGRPPAPIGLLCVALAVAWARALGARNLGRPAALAAVLVLGLSLLPADPGVSLASTKRARAFAQVFGSNAFGEMIGRESAEKYLGQKPIPRLIASGGVGRLAYYTQIPILDVLGLVDPVVARSVGTHADDRWVIPGHTRSDAGYVLSRSPDYIAIPREGTFYRIPAIVDLWAHPDFQARYVWDDYMGSYRRKDVESRRTDAAPPPARP